MAPSGLAIILGAGPNTGTGIARILSSPQHGNLAIALLARSSSTSSTTKATLLRSNPNAVLETFATSTADAGTLESTFSDIFAHPSFKGLVLKIAVFNVKHSSKRPFLETSHKDFTASLSEYVGGAMLFGQLVIKKFLTQDTSPSQDNQTNGTKGTLIFTGTLGALRTNAGYAAYGAGRSGVRMLAQALAKEFSEKGVHVVHTIMNGRIVDVDPQSAGEDVDVEKVKSDAEKVSKGEYMSADAVGREYLRLAQQGRELWTFELDMRPALEKF